MLRAYYTGKGPLGVSFLFVGLLFTLSSVMAQDTDLSRIITVHYRNTPLESVLLDLRQTAGIRFSYSPDEVPVNLQIHYRADGQPLKKVLADILSQAGLDYTLVAGYLVLRKSTVKVPEKLPDKPTLFTISGTVNDSSNSEVLIGAAVYVKETGIGALTNQYGFFSITQPSGSYTVEISHLGYIVESRCLSLNENQSWKVKLKAIPYTMKEIIVSASGKEELVNDALAGQTGLQALEVQKQPGAMGETDMLKALDMLPGISFQSDGSSYFSVRGGNRDQNLILLDEAPLYNPTHLLGLFTPVIPEAVNHAAIYRADFPVAYGGRLSSVIDIRTRDGNLQRFSGSAGIGPVSTRFSLEGPFKKDASSYALSVRRSLFGYFIKQLSPSVENFYFTDFTAKFNIKLGNRDRLFLTLFTGRDVYLNNPAGITNGLEWGNNALTLRWNHIYGNRLFSNTTFYTSKYDYSLYTDYDRKIYWNSDITSSNLKTEFSWYGNSRNKINFGLNLGAYFFNPGNYSDPEIDESMKVSQVNSGEMVLYAGHEFSLTEWLDIRYGLRLSNWSNYGEAFSIVYDPAYNPVSLEEYAKGERYYSGTFLEPRISLSFKTGRMASIKASYNRTLQHINMINNSISPLNALEVWLPSGPNIKPQLADVMDLGFVKSWPGNAVDLTADVFYKKLHNQIGYTYHAEMLLNPLLEGELRQGDGEAYGFEIQLKKTLGKFSGQISYAYTRSFLRIPALNNGRKYPSHYDKPVDLSISVDYHLRPRWMLNLNVAYGSGMALSTPTGFYYYRGKQVPAYTQQNNDRLPDYRRMDLGSVWRLNKKEKRFEHNLSFFIYNVFAFRNYAYLNFNKIRGDDDKFYVPADTQHTEEQVVTYRYMYSVIPSLTYNMRF
jgi:hypothetical protein